MNKIILITLLLVSCASAPQPTRTVRNCWTHETVSMAWPIIGGSPKQTLKPCFDEPIPSAPSASPLPAPAELVK